MKKNDPVLMRSIQDFAESGEDFVAIHWRNYLSSRESLMKCILKPVGMEKSRKEPGLSPAKCLAMIRKYKWRERVSEQFYCVYRTHNEKLATLINKEIPEENRERI